MRYDIVKIFYFLDEFCKVYEDWERHRLLPRMNCSKRKPSMALSEMLTIVVCYHLSGYKCFKYYYQSDICIKHRSCFPALVSYNRFVELMPRLYLALQLLMHMMSGDETGIYFMDSTSLNVCHNRRINRNKVFSGIAERGRSTMGWFFGFKLHVVINHKGELMAAKVTKGNVDDRKPVPELVKNLCGVVAADKGYLSKELFAKLYTQGLKLLTGIRKGMKNHLVQIYEKIILRKRFLVETVFDCLKNQCNINHSRYRSPANACINILASLAAYCFKNNKPHLKNLTIIPN